ncbi:Hypothetical protein, putative [Bodo saltans]|uniref:Uncharacterized protein n=1 Tax=Bodo saltans TaxID=75058 RepID=A0A0S4IK25_BODSA|nr:Hypothetical protein, putative [Bodo saltans]|eukprot:CUF00475.1 Hypothetical protein, putative [Bodo saltans]
MFSPTKGPAQPPPQVAAAAKKRRRDISSFGNFKNHMYLKGMQSFHASVEANPILMYPPTGIEEAREHLKLLGMLADTPAVPIPPVAGAREGDTAPPAVVVNDETAVPQHRPEPVDIDQFLRELEDPSAQQSNDQPPIPSSPKAAAAAVPGDAATLATPRAHQQHISHYLETSEGRAQTEKANYHRTQLNSLVASFYDFNHTQFVKLPVRQTVELLLRCGREAYAHLADFENEERNRKARIMKERYASRRQKEETAMAMNEGRSDYYDGQLRQAELQQQTLQAEMDNNNNSYDQNNNGEDDFEEDDDMLAHIQGQQLDDTVMYSMFPGGDEEDVDEVRHEIHDNAVNAVDDVNRTDDDATGLVGLTTNELASTVEFGVSAPSETLRVAATVVMDSNHTDNLTETLYAGVTEIGDAE